VAAADNTVERSSQHLEFQLFYLAIIEDHFRQEDKLLLLAHKHAGFPFRTHPNLKTERWSAGIEMVTKESSNLIGIGLTDLGRIEAI
jgi:hypothetical protein